MYKGTKNPENFSVFYSGLPRSSFPVCGKLCCLLSCLEWRSWSHGWNILSIFIAFFCKPLKWTPHNSPAGNPSTLTARISNLSNVFLIFLLFRLLAISLSNLHVSSVHTTELVLNLFWLPHLFTAGFQHLYCFQPQSHPLFSLLCITHTSFPLFLTLIYSQQACTLWLISDLNLLGYL